MAPNLLVKAAFVRGDYDSSKPVPDETKTIRTDFILQNVFAHLIKNGSSFQAIPPQNYKEEKVISDIIDIVNSFRMNYLSTIQNLCSQLEFSNDTMGTVLSGVANELFCEGITWSRIIALFVYVGELTLLCLVKNYSSDLVNVMYECFRKLVKENLSGWVEDHGGWEGIQSLCKSRGESNRHLPENSLPSDKGWAKSILHGTVRMIGTIAHIANTTGQNFP
ncbi:hypothetical protein JTE90_012685 [Oedothorax gibbosus]|uniref:Bcl-2 Bcl-2 homology region 1-3 domain-containing protein n=1 Tax=Oedothorax gibbosus TaxID=931172 RepID=A0AAV6VY08_9ARAC|nr:hypothetical protein JTE90_012685 [Oedothorax gibbosus]